ncbi:hypothetical protein [Spirochaeta lutea]|uniref:hypothetical protein n=1 Tax=Spirochaeta lutea TaxID=1480694 RepID=UPI00068C137F|nr:hypothetical protein [Spirochaeta lutea]
MIHSLTVLPIQDLLKISSAQRYHSSSVAYHGSPRRHPTDETRVLLICDLLSPQKRIYEFKKSDILHVDQAEQISLENGDILSLVTLWIRKGSRGIELLPFEVKD